MALINCPECGKEISDKTTVCPHCGYPIHNATIVGETQETGLSFIEEKDEVAVNLRAKSDHPVHVDNGEKSMFYCPSCKYKIHLRADVCPICGRPDPLRIKAIEKREKVTIREKFGIVFLAAIITTLIYEDGMIRAYNHGIFWFILLGFYLSRILSDYFHSKELLEKSSEEQKVLSAEFNDSNNYNRWIEATKDLVKFFKWNT